MKTIKSILAVTNETDVRGQEILRLIGTYIPGFSGRYYGFRPLGSNDLSYPCIHVVPTNILPTMDRTGKYHVLWNYQLWWFVTDNVTQDAVSLSTSCAEALFKLFSNNALSSLDYGSGHYGEGSFSGDSFTNSFKAHAGFWVNSEIKGIDISRTYVNATPGTGNKSMCAGVMRLEIEDILLK